LRFGIDEVSADLSKKTSIREIIRPRPRRQERNEREGPGVVTTDLVHFFGREYSLKVCFSRHEEIG